jgi:branched-chain amino acid transport system permease protein
MTAERARRLGRLGALAAAAVFACWLPFQLSTFDAGRYDRMGTYALTAIGLTLLMGFAGQVSLGQGAFFLFGAYTAALLTVGLDPDTRLVDPEAGIDPLLALAAAPVVTAVIAAVIGVPLLRLRGHYLAFATLSLHLIAFSLLYAQDRFTGGQYGITLAKPLEVGSHAITGATHAAVVWALVAVAAVLAGNLIRSRTGRALQAIGGGESAAAATGIHVAATKLRLFVLAAAFAGLAGGLFAFAIQYVSPDAFPVVLSVQFVVMVSVGGLGSVYGAIAGAVLIQLLEDELRDLGTRTSLLGWDLPVTAPSVLSLGAFGLILILVMLFFPRGVLPAVIGGAEAARRRLGRAA